MTRLTLTGNLSITELALDLGFYDYPHFSHGFLVVRALRGN